MSYKLRDTYYKKAKQQGYRSRAAYKLLELQERFRIFKTGQLIVDLGAAPGGWMQVAAKLVGPSGKVLGVDLQPIEAFHHKNIIVMQGDITATETEQRIMEYLGRPADSVISDLAPKLTGIRDTDEARSLELNRTAFKIAKRLLRAGGSFLIKNFESFRRNWKSNLARFSVPGLMLAEKDHLKFIFSLRITGQVAGIADYGNVKTDDDRTRLTRRGGDLLPDARREPV
jgi:cell division protein FtsJ